MLVILCFKPSQLYRVISELKLVGWGGGEGRGLPQSDLNTRLCSQRFCTSNGTYCMRVCAEAKEVEKFRHWRTLNCSCANRCANLCGKSLSPSTSRDAVTGRLRDICCLPKAASCAVCV